MAYRASGSEIPVARKEVDGDLHVLSGASNASRLFVASDPSTYR